jgi:hypothetical protein
MAVVSPHLRVVRPRFAAGRSGWTCGVAGGMEAAIKKRPVLRWARAGPDAATAGCWPQPHPRPGNLQG